MQGGPVGAGLDHGGRHPFRRGEPIGEGTRLRAHVPVEGAGHQQPLRGLQAQRMHLRILDQQGGQSLPALVEPELLRLLDRIGEVRAAVCHDHHLRLRGLRLQQIGREVCRVQRMPG